MNSIKLHFGCKSDKGNIKKNNEDNYIIKSLTKGRNKCGLIAVCDGLGGLSCGEVASKIMVDEIDIWWEEKINTIIKRKSQERYILHCLEELLREGNKKVNKKSKELEAKIGTTISCILIINNTYYVAHVGDSRIYKLENNLEQITQDHTLYERLRRCGCIEESNKVKKSILTQCIGNSDDISVYTDMGKIKNSCSFIVCSDGYYNKMDTKATIRRLRHRLIEYDNNYLQISCEKLVNDVMKAGERDNITLACMRVQVVENSFIKLIKRFINR